MPAVAKQAPAPTMQELLESLKSEFNQKIASQLQRMRQAVGKFLLSAQEMLDERYYKALAIWLKEKHRINLSEQRVCVRVANGEMSEEQAVLIPPSIAQFIATENLPDPNGEYLIYSPDQGAPIRKRFRLFSKMERKVNLSVHGIKPLAEAVPVTKHKPFETAVSSGYRVEGPFLVLIVNSLSKEVRHRITAEFVKQVSAAMKD